MATLVFQCPRTGKDIDTGIEADALTKRTLDILICRVPCPHCRFDHFPPIKRGEFLPHDWTCEALPPELTRLLEELEAPETSA
jgi:hypothetical protein